MHLSNIPQYTTWELKCAHFCPKVVHCGLWDRCIVGHVRLVSSPLLPGPTCLVEVLMTAHLPLRCESRSTLAPSSSAWSSGSTSNNWNIMQILYCFKYDTPRALDLIEQSAQQQTPRNLPVFRHLLIKDE